MAPIEGAVNEVDWGVANQYKMAEDKWKLQKERMIKVEDIMTDKQFDKILEMVSMILDGCKDLDEAKEKIRQLIENEKIEKPAE